MGEDKPGGQAGPEAGGGPGPGEHPGGQEVPAAGTGHRSTPAGAGAGPAAEAGELLSDLSRLRRRTRTARHGYWFPLVLFGVLTGAATPIYLAGAASVPATSGSYQVVNTGPMLLGGMSLGTNGFYIGWYWTAALVIGFLLTVLWYRRRARQAGVRTPARGYLITGIVLTVLAVVLPPLSRYAWWLAILWAPIGDAWIRGTFGFLIIAAGLWVLVRAERSRGLAVIALIYTAAALLSSLYNVENVLFRLGWNPGNSASAWTLTALPDVLLPAVVLLVAGLAAFFVQRRRRPA
jgi:hypothetical protein